MNLKNLNASLVTAAFAATASFNAAAVIDLDGAADQVVTISSELIAAATADGNGRHTITNDTNLLDFTNEAGFGTSDGNTTYYRYDLNGAVFSAVPTLSSEDDDSSGDSTASTGTIVLGGTAQDSFVVFEVVPDTGDNIAQDDHATIAAATIDMDPTVTSTVTYNAYGTEIDSVNQTNALATSTANLMKSGVGYVDADAVTATALVATVASEFEAWSAATGISATLGLLGTYSSAAAVVATTYALDGTAADETVLYTDGQDVTVSGDVSVGTFHIDTNVNCNTSATACTANADDTACTATAAGTQADFFVCLTLPADEAIGKNAYTLAGATNTTSVSLGTISYDTTSITLPYISTFADYNQRVYINNKGATAAYYSTTFDTESGTTAVAGASGTGTIAAGEIAMIKVSDLATLTGGTRAAAVIEIEAAAADIEATTQIINLSDGGTDTLTLTVQ